MGAYLRIVLLKPCNARCYFCHSEGESSDVSGSNLLPPETVLEAVRAASKLGITTFKFTGGEPLLYPDLARLILEMKKVCPEAEISLTTNGILLGSKIENLLTAGLDRANVSLQTLDSRRYKEIMGVDRCGQVIAGITELSQYRTGSKICSAFSRRNEDEILYLARFAKSLGLGYRVHNLLPALDIARVDVIPIEEIEYIISNYPGAKRLDTERNGKHRLIFSGEDWEIMVPNWRHWKKCGRDNCPLNDSKKHLCTEGEVYALRLNPDRFQTCLMDNRESFPFANLTELPMALDRASRLASKVV